MKITLFSFGFKHGYPEANIVQDVRFLPNPYWEEHLREHTGLEEQISAYALNNATGMQFLEYFSRLISFTVTEYKAGGKREELCCAIGCTGGRHRSVAVAEAVADRRLANPEELHRQGMEGGMEQVLSAQFIVTESYGTRSSTSLWLDSTGSAEWRELSFDSPGRLKGQVEERFTLDGH